MKKKITLKLFFNYFFSLIIYSFYFFSSLFIYKRKLFVRRETYGYILYLIIYIYIYLVIYIYI